jgi:hypothetical protein
VRSSWETLTAGTWAGIFFRVTSPRPRLPSQAYLPPPPEGDDEQPESIRFPRMEPPPLALEALVRKQRADTPAKKSHVSRLSVSVALLVAVGIAASAYLLR